jgi:hypothetical protein
MRKRHKPTAIPLAVRDAVQVLLADWICRNGGRYEEDAMRCFGWQLGKVKVMYIVDTLVVNDGRVNVHKATATNAEGMAGQFIEKLEQLTGDVNAQSQPIPATSDPHEMGSVVHREQRPVELPRGMRHDGGSEGESGEASGNGNALIDSGGAAKADMGLAPEPIAPFTVGLSYGQPVYSRPPESYDEWRQWLLMLMRCLKRARLAHAAIPTLGSSRILLAWRRTHQAPHASAMRKLQQKIAECRKHVGPAPKWFKPRPAHRSDGRIKRQYWDIKATPEMWQEREEKWRAAAAA